MGDQDKDNISMKSGGFKHENRKKLTQREINALHPTQRSKYLAYEAPPKEAVDAMSGSKKRVQDRSKQKVVQTQAENQIDMEKDKHNQLIGQLKAAEARNRLRVMRLRYQANRAQEVKHLISCQPSAIKAVRLQAMVPPLPDKSSPGDTMDKLERLRVESMLEDEMGLTINRDLG